MNIDEKIQNFVDMGMLSMSIISFHNRFFLEVRNSFVIGSYYPSLTAACALGERILNHLILILKEDFKGTPEYKKVYRKKSFDDWDLAIKTLAAWSVFDFNIAAKFADLKDLRNRSIHFNHDTYSNVRADSLQAIKLLSEIISLRFGLFRKEHGWGINGAKGAQFIKKGSEADPFIKRFYLPICPLVSPYYAVKFIDQGTLFVDRARYNSSKVTDGEFAEIYNNRQASEIVNSDLPLADDVEPIGIAFHDGTFQLVEKVKPKISGG